MTAGAGLRPAPQTVSRGIVFAADFGKSIISYIQQPGFVMTEITPLGIIGAGKMGASLMAGVLQADLALPGDVYISEPDQEPWVAVYLHENSSQDRSAPC